jgi:hypothetical protein
MMQLLRDNDPTPHRWEGIDRGWPAAMYYWRRQRPTRLTQRLAPNDATGWSMPGRVTPRNPPVREPGETCVFLDLAGRLIEFRAISPRIVPENAPARAPWDQLLEAAGLESAHLTPVPPRRVPPVFADETTAWEGIHPDRPDLSIRIEAAAFRGQPVYFHMGLTGTRDRTTFDASPVETADLLQDILYGILGFAALTAGAYLAWRNRRVGRADRSGAFRLAGAFAIATLLGWLFTAKHVAHLGDESAMLAGMLGRTFLDALTVWLAYLALEPFVRRRTPWGMIGWNRLLQGRWFDPRVGRDVLIGLLAGVVGEGIALALTVAARGLGYPTEFRIVWDAPFTEGPGILLTLTGYSLLTGIREFFLFMLIRLACRRDWQAVLLSVAILSAPMFVGAEAPMVKGLAAVAFYSLAFVLLFRVGVLAFLTCKLASTLIVNMPMALDLSVWYSIPSTATLLLLTALAIYGFVVATRGREVAA